MGLNYSAPETIYVNRLFVKKGDIVKESKTRYVYKAHGVWFDQWNKPVDIILYMVSDTDDELHLWKKH